jgi:type IV secretory pathway VirB3-like protein
MPRSNPIVKSLAQPLTVKGCAYELFTSAVAVAMAILILGFIMGRGLSGLLIGIAAFALLFKVGQWITAHDPQLLTILLSSWTWCRSLDSKKFQRRK